MMGISMNYSKMNNAQQHPWDANDAFGNPPTTPALAAATSIAAAEGPS